MRAVNCTTMAEAAQQFANRYARGVYGRRAYASCLVSNVWSQDGTMVEYSAFCGLDRDGGMVGKNIMFSVYEG